MYRETMLGTDTTVSVVIYSWKYRAMMSFARNLISHSKYWKSWECLVAFNGIPKSQQFIGCIWCVTSTWLRKPFRRYVPLIALEASMSFCWLLVHVEAEFFYWWRYLSNEAAERSVSVRTDLFMPVHWVFQFVRTLRLWHTYLLVCLVCSLWHTK